MVDLMKAGFIGDLHLDDGGPDRRPPPRGHLQSHINQHQDILMEDTSYHVRGSRHYRAKLTEADIPVIRQMNRDGVAQTVIARQYGVKQPAIWFVIAKRSWSHIPD